MAFMTYSSWDFPSDARGYSWGGTAELYWDDWGVRIGRITPPLAPNQLPTDFRINQYFGDQVELSHDHKLLGQAGAVRLLGYRNQVDTGSFQDAINKYNADPATYNANNCPGLHSGITWGPGVDLKYFNYGSQNAGAPDMCWVRKPNVKMGIGVDLEQHITDDIGVFFRACTPTVRPRSTPTTPPTGLSPSAPSPRGQPWHRPFDIAGAGFAMSWISDVHAQYLAMGGVDGFVGDGNLARRARGWWRSSTATTCSRRSGSRPTTSSSGTPGTTLIRGPVSIFGGRIHAEF